MSNEQRLNRTKTYLQRSDELANQLKELTRIQRLLSSKGHRIDLRVLNDFNGNMKIFEGQIHQQTEKLEKISQTENDFHQLEKEFDSYLQTSSEQFKGITNQQDKTLGYQVKKVVVFLFIIFNKFLFSQSTIVYNKVNMIFKNYFNYFNV